MGSVRQPVFSACHRFFFFFQAEDGIRDHCVTGVQTCALPILNVRVGSRNTVVSCTPPARLVTNSGVTPMEGVCTVSIRLAHGSSTASRSAFTGEAFVLSARSQNG